VAHQSGSEFCQINNPLILHVEYGRLHMNSFSIVQEGAIVKKREQIFNLQFFFETLKCVKQLFVLQQQQKKNLKHKTLKLVFSNEFLF
jgi:hypothetical protein